MDLIAFLLFSAYALPFLASTETVTKESFDFLLEMALKLQKAGIALQIDLSKESINPFDILPQLFFDCGRIDFKTSNYYKSRLIQLRINMAMAEFKENGKVASSLKVDSKEYDHNIFAVQIADSITRFTNEQMEEQLVIAISEAKKDVEQVVFFKTTTRDTSTILA